MPSQTPLFEIHTAARAHMAEFAGWTMPIYYTSIIDEHTAVRMDAGLFDLCHMGVLEIVGPKALAFLQRLLTNNIARIADSEAVYSPMCLETGGTIDDLIVYRLGGDRFSLIVNASNRSKDYAWILSQNREGCRVTDRSESLGILGVQGPNAFDVMGRALGAPLPELKYFAFHQLSMDGVPVTVARTGYTGEKGVEILAPRDRMAQLWRKIASCRGGDRPVSAVGLGARDTLRMEMGYSLYGHELTDSISPIEAGLGWTVDLTKDAFIGKARLVEHAARPPRRLWGFDLEGRGVARHGAAVLDGEREVGRVTSGGYSPTLKQNIGLALVENAGYGENHTLEIQVRPGTRQKCRLRGRVFYHPRVR